MTGEDDRIEPYLCIIRAYTDGRMTASQFMSEFLQEFKYDDEIRPSREFEILNRMFFAVEDYCEDPDLRREQDIGEEELFIEVAYVRRELEELRQDT